MSKASSASRRARKQLRDACLRGDGAAVLALIAKVDAESRSRHRGKGYVWAPEQQFARLGLDFGPAANDASYEA